MTSNLGLTPWNWLTLVVGSPLAILFLLLALRQIRRGTPAVASPFTWMAWLCLAAVLVMVGLSIAFAVINTVVNCSQVACA